MPQEGPKPVRPVAAKEAPAPPLRRRWAAGLRRLREEVSVRTGGRVRAELLALTCFSLFIALSVAADPWRLGAVVPVLGLAIMAGVLIWALSVAWLPRLGLTVARRGLKEAVFLAAVLTFSVVVARGYFLFAGALAPGWAHLSGYGLAFGTPLAAAPLTTALFLGPAAGMLVALAGGVIAALIWPHAGGLMVYFLVTGVVAAHMAAGGRTRLALIKAGLGSSAAGVILVLALALWQGWAWSLDITLAIPAALLSGLLAGVLAAGLAPLAEMAFGYTTDAKLMELASLDQPALQELMLQAPGTYHHSLIVSSLVEAAGREIGANHLLAKVAALYHDVGKIKKAAYFVENQMGCPNRHEKLAPSMSALILASHVKEGVEVARKHRLGEPIIDIMAQHHGTRVIHFFYNKAVACRRQAGQAEPDPDSFRYPGPRPQTKEAGLVMLADVVEAASRSLDNPTPARIRGLVQTQISKVFTEGQLDECELTLKDLHKIAKSFNNILVGIFHQRVEYPEPADKARKRNGDTDTGQQRPAGEPADKADDADGNDLKRLGMLR